MQNEKAKVICDRTGFRTCVLDTGGEGEAMILLHPLALDNRAWQFVVPLLDERYRLLMPDLQGHGSASMALEPHDFRRQANDIAKIMDEMQVPNAHVVGISMGGVVAQFFALGFPNRIRSLTLVATLCVGTEVFLKRAEELGDHDMSELVKITLRRWFTADAIAANLPAVMYARECLGGFAPQSWKAYWRALAGVDLIAQLPNIAVPTQLVAGEFDLSTTPQSMEGMRRAIRSARLHVVPGAPHLISLERPHELAAVLANADELACSTPTGG